MSLAVGWTAVLVTSDSLRSAMIYETTIHITLMRCGDEFAVHYTRPKPVPIRCNKLNIVQLTGLYEFDVIHGDLWR